MKNILIINGAKTFAHSNGRLNNTFVSIAQEHLESQGFNVQVTIADHDYDPKEEVQKYLWADVIIYQMPGWWMGEPWTVKKYIDDVFTEGQGLLYANDGRTRSDPNKKYGSGGLIQGKKYMLSLTWNAPAEAFSDPQQFFHGTGVDNVYMHFHKANQFLGMESLPTFIVHDVIKNSDIQSYINEYQQHLSRLFNSSFK